MVKILNLSDCIKYRKQKGCCFSYFIVADAGKLNVTKWENYDCANQIIIELCFGYELMIFIESFFFILIFMNNLNHDALSKSLESDYNE